MCYNAPMIQFFKTIIYTPLYNILAFFVGVIPGHSLAVAIILLTALVRALIFPLNKRALISQARMKEIEPQLRAIKEYTKDQKELAEKTLALYKEHKIHPFSGCLPILLQLPVIISLYYVFLNELTFSDVLYPFITIPETVNSFLFGINLYEASAVLAVLAGLSQFVQAWQSKNLKKTGDVEGTDMQAAIQKSMRVQLLFLLPILITVFAWKLPAAVALYWVVNNIISIVQERIIFKTK